MSVFYLRSLRVGDTQTKQLIKTSVSFVKENIGIPNTKKAQVCKVI